MNNKRLKKYFKILFVPISMLICLSLFLINSFASDNFIIDNNGNIESLNLANLNNFDNNNLNTSNAINFSINNQTLILSNTDSNDNDPYIYFNNFIDLKPNTTYSYYFISNNNLERIFLTYNNTTDLYLTIFDIKQSFTTNTTDFEFGIGFECLQGLNYNIQLMIYEGSDSLDFIPYGTFYQSQNFDFMDYLIGNNYFTNGRVSIIQTNDGQYWDKPFGSNYTSGATIGSTTINQYINGNVLNLSTLSYDLINVLKQQSNYRFDRFTYLDLLPCLNLPTSSATYEEIQAKYVNISIYCPIDDFTCDVALGNSILSSDSLVHFEQVGQYINISFDSDDSRFVNGIYIVLNRSGSDFVVPNNAVSNTNDTISWDLYQMGFDDGFESQQENLSVLQGQYNRLSNLYDSIVSSNNVLKQQVENLQNALDNNFGFSNVFFALADTPFRTASNMLGFELFGVNLFNALIGFITVLACIWLLKKFL